MIDAQRMACCKYHKGIKKMRLPVYNNHYVVFSALDIQVVLYGTNWNIS
jgi:hypothetical protein